MEERLTDVPIAITAISQDKLQSAGITNSNDIGLITPGLFIPQTGQNVQPTIRGIGTSITAVGADANVAIYLDGVYQPVQTGNSFDLPDIDQIEVLKGPQGTLFGRNATGGAILIHTKAPSFTFQGDATASYGSFNEKRLHGWVTGPITDTLAASISLVSVHDDGYSKNVALDNRASETNEDSLRVKLLYQPEDDLKFTLEGDWSDRMNNIAQSVKPENRNVSSLRTHPDLYIPSDPYEISLNDPPYAALRSAGASLTSEYSPSYGTFTSTTSYSGAWPHQLFDTDYTSLPLSLQDFTTPANTFTQELNFASHLEGPLNFVAGLFYFNNVSTLTRYSYAGGDGPLTAYLRADVDTESVAGYAEAHYQVTDKLRLIGGLRYSDESKSILATGVLGGPNTLDTSNHWTSLTPRASAIYALTDDSNVYFTYSKGFKAGAYNPSFIAGVPVQTDAVDPEKVAAYEVGYKVNLGNTRFNSSAFYYKYDNIQVQILTSVGGVNTTVIENAANAEIYGGDFDFSTKLDENWRFDGGVAYTHGKYLSFPGAVLTTPIPGGGNTQFLGDASGNDMTRNPEWLANVGFTYDRPVGEDTFEASVMASYNGGYYFDPGNRVQQDPYTIVNGNLSWIFGSDGKYRVSLWGTNLLNRLYAVYAAQSTTGDNIAYGRPRSVGVSVGLNFD
jgi:iron complex outermembrane receptor protein